MKKKKSLIGDNEPLKYAVCAIGFFRIRHKKIPLYKKAKNKKRALKVQSRYLENVRLCRIYISKARRAGWRGSVIDHIIQNDIERGRI